MHSLVFSLDYCLGQFNVDLNDFLWCPIVSDFVWQQLALLCYIFSSWHSKVHLWMWYKIKYWIRCENLLKKIGKFYDAQWQYGWYLKIKRTWLKGCLRELLPKWLHRWSQSQWNHLASSSFLPKLIKRFLTLSVEIGEAKVSKNPIKRSRSFYSFHILNIACISHLSEVIRKNSRQKYDHCNKALIPNSARNLLKCYLLFDQAQ